MPMRAKNRAEGSELEPAGIQFLILRVSWKAFTRLPIASDIGCPVRISGQREIQSTCHLMAQSPIGAVDIARPDCSSNSLLAQKCGTRKQKYPLLICSCSPVLLHSGCVHKWEYICVLRPIPDRDLLIAQDGIAHMRPVFFGFGTVEPERVPSHGEQLAG